MLEAQRIAYLEALGITQYVALSPIAGALQLPVLEPETINSVGEPAAGVVVQQSDSLLAEKNEAAESEKGAWLPPIASESDTESDTESDSEAATGIESIAPGFDPGIPELDLSKLGLLPTEKKTPDAVVNTERLRPFSCLTVPFGSGSRILLQLSNADAPGLNSVEHRMLSDLLCALGELKMPDQQGARIYRWPVINNARIAADPIAALDAISAFLSAADAVSHTLIMGHQVAIALGLAKTRDAQVVGQLPGRFLAVPGFTEMQADWKVKADTWSRISSFLATTA